jgi:hypothetical protein
MMPDLNHPQKVLKYFKCNSVDLSDLMQKRVSGNTLNDQLKNLFKMQCDNILIM